MTTARTRNSVLAIVERAYRGMVEKQFFDVFYLATELHRQVGGLDIALRGHAVSYALRARPAPLLIAGRRIDELADPRADLAGLIAAGVGVFADRADLARHCVTEPDPDRLLAGVEVLDRADVTRTWPNYRSVCFL